jgi:hypothetical protein
METTKYACRKDLITEFADDRFSECKLYECEFSISFRLFDDFGNTLELHIFYK